MSKNKGFTLMEVLIAIAIAGLVITGGFRLIAMSYRLMSEIENERNLILAAQKIWLRFRTEKDMPDTGTDDENNIKWRAEKSSVPVDAYELNYKRVTVSTNDRSMIIYVPE